MPFFRQEVSRLSRRIHLRSDLSTPQSPVSSLSTPVFQLHFSGTTATRLHSTIREALSWTAYTIGQVGAVGAGSLSSGSLQRVRRRNGRIGGPRSTPWAVVRGVSTPLHR